MIPHLLMLCLGSFQEPQIVRAEDLKITTHPVVYLSPEDVYLAVQSLAGREYQLGDRTISNLSLIYDRILIYDTPAETAKLLEMIEALDREVPGNQADLGPRFDDYQTATHRLRAMPAHAAVELLQPYHRSVEAWMQSGESTAFMTVTVVDGSTLLLRDLPENLRAMQELLTGLDRPAAQLMLRAWVLRAAPGASTGAASPLPAALKSGLDQILPGQTWHLESHGGVRMSANASESLQLSLPSVAGVPYQLSLELAAYDAESGSLSLAQCVLSANSEVLFQTEAAIQAQEYAVIGISGSEPVLLVLQMVPLGR